MVDHFCDAGFDFLAQVMAKAAYDANCAAGKARYVVHHFFTFLHGVITSMRGGANQGWRV